MKKIVLIAICAMISQVSPSQPVSESSPQKIKILSWNIYMLPGVLARVNGKRASAIGEVLAESEYDVVVFQEAFCPWARHKIRKKMESQFSYQAGPANRKLFSLKTNSGLWIVSRYPILAHQAIAYKNRKGADALSRKGALLVDLKVGNNKVQIAATHLQNSGEAWLRHAQCVELYERLLKPNEIAGVPQIICGDFNINKNTAADSYRFMLNTLNAEDGDLEGERVFSYDRLTNDLHVERGITRDLIDFILVRENGAWLERVNRRIQVIRKRWGPVHEDLSDHYSMEVEIYFTKFPPVISLR